MTIVQTLHFEKQDHLFDRVYCVHLTERCDSQQRLQGFIDAVQASDWMFGDIQIYRAIDGIKTHKPFQFQHNGTWGCCKSHFNIIEECLNENVRTSLILEDDIRFHERVYSTVNEYVNSVPSGWDIIYFYNNDCSGEYTPITEMYGMCSRPLGTSAYAISHKAMKRLYFVLAYGLYTDSPVQSHGHVDQILANWISQGSIKAYSTRTHTIGNLQGCSSTTSAMSLKEGSFLIPSLDVVLTNHCNLSCKNCCQLHQKRFPKEHIDIDLQLQVLNEWFNKGLVVTELRLLGGEPFLLGADRLLKVFNRIREFHENSITLITNGTLLDDMPDWFYRCCRSLGVQIAVSNQLGNANTHKPNVHGVTLQDWNYGWCLAHKFDQKGQPIYPNSDPQVAWENCPNGGNCYALRNEMLYHCSWHAARVSVYNAGGLSEEWKNNCVAVTGCPSICSLQDFKDYTESHIKLECAGCFPGREWADKEQDFNHSILSGKLNTPKIKVVQYCHGNFDAYDIIRQVNEKYCQRHGYEHIVKTNRTRMDRAVPWEKVSLMRDELHDCDFLLFVDADAFFYTHEFTIENELLPFFENSKHLMMAADCMYEGLREQPHVLNTGAVLVRNTHRAAKIIQLWDELSDQPEFKKYRFDEPQLEQGAFYQGIWQKYSEDVQRLQDYYVMNSSYGQFICHLFQNTDHQRLCRLQKYSKHRNGCSSILSKLRQRCPDLCMGCQDPSRIYYDCQMEWV